MPCEFSAIQSNRTNNDQSVTTTPSASTRKSPDESNALVFSYLLELGDGYRQVQDVVTALEKSVHPREDGVVLHPPGV